MAPMYKSVVLDRQASQSVYAPFDSADKNHLQRVSSICACESNSLSHGCSIPFTVDSNHLSVTSTPYNDDDQYPSVSEIENIIQEYLNNLSSKKRDKALIDRDRYMLILQVLKQPKNTALSTAQFRFWVKKMFQLVSFGGTDFIYHDNKPVAVREDIYAILVCAHNESRHGGRDKTSVLVRQRYSWIPKELIARFVRSCPICTLKRNGNQSPTLGMPRASIDSTSHEQFYTMERGYHMSNDLDLDIHSDECMHRSTPESVYEKYNRGNISYPSSESDCLHNTPLQQLLDPYTVAETEMPEDHFKFGAVGSTPFEAYPLCGVLHSEPATMASTFDSCCNTCQPVTSNMGYTADMMNSYVVSYPSVPIYQSHRQQSGSISPLSCSPSTTSSEHFMQSTPSVHYADFTPNYISAGFPPSHPVEDPSISLNHASLIFSDTHSVGHTMIESDDACPSLHAPPTNPLGFDTKQLLYYF